MAVYRRDDGSAGVHCHSHGCDWRDILAAFEIASEEYIDFRPTTRRPVKVRPEPMAPELAAVLQQQAAGLQFEPTLKSVLRDERAWSDDVIGRYGVGLVTNWKGYDEPWFSIPVANPAGEPVTAIMYRPASMRPEGERGVDIGPSWTRWPLYLLDGDVFKDEETVLICEAEADALAVRSAGHPAVGAPGASSWSDAFTAELVERGVRRVAVVGDRDDAGEKFNQKVSSSVAAAGIDCVTIAVPLDHPGADVTDVLVQLQPADRHDALHGLVSNAATSTFTLEDIEPATMLADVEQFVRRFLWLPNPDHYLVVALWIMSTHALDAFARTGYLAITSPERMCGKTQALELLEALCARPWKIDGPPTEAVLFRKIEASTPTLLLDEVDLLVKAGDQRFAAIASMLNSGYKRGATVPRCVGEGASMETRDFSVFCPKALAGINARTWPDTLRSRCLPIHLHRVPQADRAALERWRPDRLAHEIDPLRDRLAAWGEAAVESLREYQHPQVDELSPRAEEILEPLFAIAAAAGCVDRAQTVAISLMNTQGSGPESTGALLLGALRTMFEHRDRMTTAEILVALNEDETLPFTSFHGGDGMRPRDLANLLGRYGVSPTAFKLGGRTLRGYMRSDLSTNWDLYAAVVDAEGPQPKTSTQPEIPHED